MSLPPAFLLGWLCTAEPTTSGETPLDALPTAERNEALAREAWDKGAKAFGEGRLEEAIKSFERTYRYSGRPGPLFSLGQAHRHRWEQEKDPRQRELAILRYKQYLEVDPDGARRLEAERWIKELQRVDELEGLGDPPPIFTRLSVSSRTEGATASIDGGKALPLPVTPDVGPGKHEVIVSAPGFRPQRREVLVPEGSTVPVELTLEPVDALLTVRGPAGSDLYVDGQRVARLPTRAAVPVPPGTHQIGVAKPGKTLFVRDVELGRGEKQRIDAELEMSGQRKVAYAAIGVGAGAAVASIALMGVAFDAQRRARPIDDELMSGGGIPESRNLERERHIARRDTFRTAAIATGVTGLGVLATGIILYFTDRPPIASQLHGPRSRRASVRPRLDVERGFAGASVRGVF